MLSTPSVFTELPNELFLSTTIGELKKEESASNAIRTLCKLRRVSQELKEKVDSCLGDFAKHVGNASLLLPLSQKIENPLQCLQTQYSILKKWEETDPNIKQAIVVGCMEQAVINNHLGNPELWVMQLPRNVLVCMNLTTQEISYLRLAETANPAGYGCVPFIVSSEKWLAIYSDDVFNGNRMEISIIDINSGSRSHKITDIGSISQLQFDQEFLYVLAHDSSNNSKLLRYDSNNWSADPKELCLPAEKVHRFYLGTHEFLFSTSCVDKNYQLLAVKKENCFSSAETSFIATLPQSECPRLRVTNGRFFIINSDSNSSTPSAILSELYVTDSSIISQPLQNLSVACSKVMDFYVQLDRIFILKKEAYGNFSIACFDLTDGRFIKDFIPTAKRNFGTNLEPLLIASAPDRIQLIYSSSVDIKVFGQADMFVYMGNALMTLDYA